MANRVFSKAELDGLKEMVNIGTGHAATALSQMISKKIMVEIPEISVVPLTELTRRLGGPETPIVGLFFKITGDLSGSIFLYFPKDMAEKLVKLLVAGLPAGDVAGDEAMEKAALMEVGNVMANSYLNAMAELMDLKILLSVPYYAGDCLGAVIDFLLIEIAEVSENALLMKTRLDSQETSLTGSFMIFPEEESFERIFDKMGLKKKP